MPKLKKGFSLFLALVVTFVSMNLGQAFSNVITEIEGEIQETQEEIRTREAILAQTQAYIDSILNGNLTLDQKIAALEGEIAKLDEELTGAKARLAQKEAELTVKQEEVQAKIDGLQAVSQSLYKSSRVTLLEIMLSQDSGAGFLRSYVFKKYAFNSQSVSLKELSEEMKALELERAVLEAEKTLLDDEMAALDESKVALDEEKAKIMQQLYAQTYYQGALQSEISMLNSQLGQLSSDLEAAIAAKTNTGGSSSGGGNSSGGTSPQPPSGNPGTYDIYTDCDIQGGQYVNCVQVADNVAGPVRVLSQSNDNVFEIELSKKYRGVLEFRADSNAYVINELPFEYYLRGIGEMPSSWPADALKSQAVAARTYAAKNWNKRLADKYNLRSDTYDQNYVGYNKEAEAGYGHNWVNAVDATTGSVITYGGDIISAYYHSTSGGHTLASEEVWVSALPYVRAESDWYQSGGIWRSYDEVSPFDYWKWGSTSGQSGYTIDDAQMIDLLNAALYLEIDIGSPTRQAQIRRPDLGGWSAQQIEDALGAGNRIQDRIGTLTNVQSVYNNGSTNIDGSAKWTNSVTISGTGGSYTFSWDVFWIVFNARSPGDLALNGRFWTSAKEGSSWNFYSRSWGHRVGMSQYGAFGRANAGQTYDQILNHYYRDTNLGTFAPPSEFRVGIMNMSDGDIFIRNITGGNYDVYSNGAHISGVSASNTLRVVKQ